MRTRATFDFPIRRSHPTCAWAGAPPDSHSSRMGNPIRHWQPLQTGESSSLDLKEVGQRCDSIHCRSIYSEWIRSLSHSLSGGWVARPAKCDRLLLCSARGRRGEAPGSESPAGGLRCAVGFCDCTKRCPWCARLHHQSSSRTLVAPWSAPRATRPTPRTKKKCRGRN